MQSADPTNLTPEQREVIERIRANTQRFRAEGTRRAREVGYRRHDPALARAAAIAAHDQGLTFEAAAQAHGDITGEAVRYWYRKLYPNEPRRPGRRKATP